MNKFAFVLMATFFLLGGFAAATVHGAAFAVNSSLDSNDAFPGDGICADAAGNCTLRAAVQETNALAGVDSISFSLSAPIFITLSAGELPITDNLTVQNGAANSVIVSAANSSRVFNVQRSSITLTIRGLTIANGRSPAGQSGGCIYAPTANLTIENAVVRNCFTDGSGGGVSMGYGVFRLIGSTLENNIAGGSNSGGGGASFAGNGSEISNSRIINNDAVRGGGGLEIGGGTTLVSNTTLAGNTAGGGAGMLVFYGAARVIGSTFSGNRAVRAGGGIALPYGTVTLINSTVSGNSVTAGEGGGISTGTNGSVGYLTVRNSTVVRNSANYAGGLTGGANGTTIVGNSIVAENIAPVAPNIASVFNSLGGNIVNDRAGGSGYVETDLPDGTNPLIGALANNGGATETHALLPNSPAINAGINSLAVDFDNLPLAFDQRGSGFPRIVGATVDIGAFETGAVSTVFGHVKSGVRGIAFVQVTMTDQATGETRTTRTNQFGAYRFENVTAGKTYILNATFKRLNFAVNTLRIEGTSHEINFTANNF